MKTLFRLKRYHHHHHHHHRSGRRHHRRHHRHCRRRHHRRHHRHCRRRHHRHCRRRHHCRRRRRRLHHHHPRRHHQHRYLYLRLRFFTASTHVLNTRCALSLRELRVHSALCAYHYSGRGCGKFTGVGAHRKMLIV